MSNCIERQVQAGSDGAGAAHISAQRRAIVPLVTLREIASLGDKFMNMLKKLKIVVNCNRLLVCSILIVC